jgi:hypothetical protein
MASLYLPKKVRISPLLVQAIKLCGLISVALSYAFLASSYLPKLLRAFPLLYPASESCGLILIAVLYGIIDFVIYFYCFIESIF